MKTKKKNKYIDSGGILTHINVHYKLNNLYFMIIFNVLHLNKNNQIIWMIFVKHEKKFVVVWGMTEVTGTISKLY